MSAKKPWTIDQAEHVLDQIAESIENAPADEIKQELVSTGADLEMITAQTRAALLSGVKKFQQQRLHRARARYEENSRRIENRKSRIASDSEDRRSQFFRLLKANPNLQSRVTFQHRDLDSLTDGDIESALEELDALGALEDLDENRDEPES